MNISTADNIVTIHDFELHPRFNKKQFESHFQARKEMYNIIIPKISLQDFNWWNVINQKDIIARKASIMVSVKYFLTDHCLFGR